MASKEQSKVVFVGNVPYNMGEEQLIDAFKSVGQVVGFRLVYDRDTGKPKGYGFCEFADHDTALSAVRNLNGQEIGGRPLRIDLADSDPFLEGKTTVRGELVDGGETRAQWRERQHGSEREPNSFLRQLPQGVPLPPGTNAMDHISNVLATTQPSQILEVLAQMKAFIITHPDHARQLLMAHPQLGYALFQALLLNKIVDTAVLERMLAATGGAPPAAVHQPPPPPPQAAPYGQPPMHQPQAAYGAPQMQMPPPPGAAHHPTPPVPAPMYPPAPHMPPPAAAPYGYRPPPPAAPQPPPAAAPVAAATQAFDPASRDMLMQVLNLTQAQIDSLPPTERDQIYQLRQQFGVPAPSA
ncbi:cleavage stimulation factor subunit 2 [Phanerochaete sordida]|uniref:Cleavage stimulation factor subunit 2 n=1 Tax=Phanerochaete sordida TaxID=48140 RepID=A0A9P3L8P2_9APHY|nr:cleavage stimulation factor subunit 2 [Phanerochaete sordida]